MLGALARTTLVLALCAAVGACDGGAARSRDSGQGGGDAASDGGTGGGGGDAAAQTDRASDAPTSGPACDGPATSNLPGVSLAFPGDRCSYTLAEAAAGITIGYEVLVARDLAGVHPRPTDAGRCEQPGSSGLIVSFSLDGGGQSYCLCDTGLCPAPAFTTAPRSGRTGAQITWDGRNWNGPSDTGNPEGAPFPPGTYLLSLRAAGTWDGASGDGGAGGGEYQVTASRFITITP